MTIFSLKKNDAKFSKRVENTVGKGEIACYDLISPFPTAFSKYLYLRDLKERPCLQSEL